MNMINRYSFYLFAISMVVLMLITGSCNKEDDAPPNPYDGIDYDTDTNQVSNPDPNSIVGLHKNIFSVKCAMPGCHDGTFEPDFRTVQSSYSTLVYQPVNKYTVNGVDSFLYRVLPLNPAKSFIHERITTTTSDYMPSNGNRLSAAEIGHIDTWISNGAKDQNGNVPVKPDNLPFVVGFVAFDSTITQRFDTIKKDGIAYNPFLVPQNQTFVLLFVIEDDETPVSQLTYNKLKVSTNKDNFSGAATFNASYVNFFGFEVWQVTLNSSAFTPGQDYYFRYYVNDGTHSNNLEFPRDEMPFYYKTIFAFYIP